VSEKDLPPVPLGTPVVDRSGRVTQPWAGWLRQLFFRVGGHTAKTNLELDLGSPESITTDLLADGAVTTEKLALSAVTTSRIADGSISSGKLLDSSVITSKIAPGAVTTTKIADGAVGTTQLNDGSVTTGKLADSAVTGAKIQTQTVSVDKFDPTGAAIGQIPRYDGIGVVWQDVPVSSASGGQLVTDGAGDNEINISPKPSNLVLQDSGAVKWDVKIANDGSLYTVSGSSGSVSDPFKIQKPDASFGQLGVNTDGTLYVDSVPTATTVNNLFYLQSPDLTVWLIAIDNLNEIQVIGDTGNGNRLSIVSSTGKVLWQLRALPGYIALQYLQVLSASNLTTATPPPSVSGCLPMAFYDSGSAKRLIFHDGSAWRYVHDNSLV
jgi:hypothetical protein